MNPSELAVRPRADIEALAEEALAEIKASGATPTEVAVELIARSWGALPLGQKKELAICGLGKIIADALHKERQKRWEELTRPTPAEVKEREDRALREAERKERSALEDEAERAKLRDPAFSLIVEEMHRRFCCSLVTHHPSRSGSFAKRADCVEWQCSYIAKKRDPRLLTHEEIEAVVAFAQRPAFERHEAEMAVLDLARSYGYENAVRDLRQILLISSDGSMKGLLDFTLEDVRQWKAKSESTALSWEAREAFFALAESMLLAADVDSVCSLPHEKIMALAKEAEAIWKKHALQPREVVAV